MASMMNRRRRRVTIWDGMVRLGPTTESGWLKYANGGRELLPAAHGDNLDGALSVLTYLTAAVKSTGDKTVIVRFCPKWAGNDGAQHTFGALLRSGPSHGLYLDKGTNSTLNARVSDGTNTGVASVSGMNWAAGTTHTAILRLTAGSKIDLRIDGVDAAQGNTSANPTFVGVTPGGTGALVAGSVGPMLIVNSRLATTDPLMSAHLMDLQQMVALAPNGTLILPLQDDSTGRYKGFDAVPFDARVGQVSLRFDDGTTEDYEDSRPLLNGLGLRAGFAIIQGNIGDAGSMTLEQLLQLQADGHELMAHSRTHGADPADLAAFTDETVTSATEMRALGMDIHSFVQPGTWTGAQNIATTDYWGSAQDLLLRANFDAYEGNIVATRPLPMPADRRWGTGHTVAGSSTYAAVKALVDNVSGMNLGLELLFHSADIGGVGKMSAVDFEATLAYIAAQRDRGHISVLTPTKQLAPDVVF